MACFKFFLLIILITQNVVVTKKPSKEKEKIIQCENYQKINRGEFARPFVDNESLNKMSSEELSELQRGIEKEIICSYSYNILYHLKVTDPRYYNLPTSISLYDHIDNMCPWPRNMLVHVFSMNIATMRSYTNLFFLFYLYLKRIITNINSKNDEDFVDDLMQIHDTMFKIFQFNLTSNKCIMYRERMGVKHDFNFYFVDIQHETPCWKNTFVKLAEDCIQIKDNIDNSKIEIDGDYFNLEPLYLNNVVSNPEIMENLMTVFGHIDIGEDLKNTMLEKMKVINTRSSKFKDYIDSLGQLCICFVQTLNIIILQIFMQHLKYMKTTATSKQLENEMFYRQFNDYTNFLGIRETANESLNIYHKDNIGSLIYTFKKESENISKLELQTDKLLVQIHTFLKNTVNVDYPTPLDTYNTAVTMPDLKAFANRTPIYFNPNSPDSIVCAEVFVNYIKMILHNVNFKVIELAIGLPRYFNRYYKLAIEEI